MRFDWGVAGFPWKTSGEPEVQEERFCSRPQRRAFGRGVVRRLLKARWKTLVVEDVRYEVGRLLEGDERKE